MATEDIFPDNKMHFEYIKKYQKIIPVFEVLREREYGCFHKKKKIQTHAFKCGTFMDMKDFYLYKNMTYSTGHSYTRASSDGGISWKDIYSRFEHIRRPNVNKILLYERKNKFENCMIHPIP